MKELKKELGNRERCDYAAVSHSKESPRKEDERSLPLKKQGEKGPPTTYSLVTGSEGNPKPTCSYMCYCRQQHPSIQCTMVTSVQKRKEILRNSGRCFICIRKNHLSRNCHSRSRCSKCQGRHHSSICEPNETPAKQANAEGQKRQSTVSGKEVSSVNMCVGSRNTVLLQTAKTAIYSADNRQHKATVGIILDGGSQRSYVTERLCDAMNLPVSHSESLTIKPFGSNTGTRQQCRVANLCIATEGDDDVFLSAICVPVISSPVQGQFIGEAVRNYPHIAGLKLADNSEGEVVVDVLIGADQYWNIVTGIVIQGNSGPTAMHTKLGWVLSGPVCCQVPSASTNINLTSTHVLKCQVSDLPDPDLMESKLEKFWRLESLGIVSNESSVYDDFQQRISYDGMKYEGNLPWKEPHPILPDNYILSKNRLVSLLSRLKRNPEVFKEYHAVIREQLNTGIVEKVEEGSEGEVGGEVHYLAHHPVIRHDKQTTKVRVVYDASAKQSGGSSLNDCLYSGPPLSLTIADVLIRFRCHKTALIGDIEKAFVMISVAEDDRDALRFLWFDDPFSEDPKIIVLRFAPVAFGLSSSPFLLNATLKHHILKYESEDPEFVKELLQSLYVDDIISGDSDDNGAYELYIKTKSRLAEGGFNARKFATNSRNLARKIEENERFLEGSYQESSAATHKANSQTVMEEEKSYAKSATQSPGTLPATEKVLGLHWNKDDDHMFLERKGVVEDLSLPVIGPTKRDAARITSKVYDPLGFVTPVTVKMKLFCQSLCKKKMGWDEILDESSRSIWNDLLKGLKDAQSVRVPRCFFSGVKGKVLSTSLQGFCDASVNAYAAVVYLRIETAEETYLKCVTSKTRVAPLVEQTIPRLELLSALILARLVSHVKSVLEGSIPISHVRCWSHSEVALHWIRGENREWKQFVQNRVCEIRRIVPPHTWSHCSSKENPADIASRGTSPATLSESTWFSGPEWLKSYEETKQINEESIRDKQSPIESLQEAKATV